MTYFFMLLFVFWFLYRVGMAFTNFAGPSESRPWVAIIINMKFAALGTFFFYNIW